jgi:hypothetical protein
MRIPAAIIGAAIALSLAPRAEAQFAGAKGAKPVLTVAAQNIA